MNNKSALIAYFNAHAAVRDRWRKRNAYYNASLEALLRFLVGAPQSLVEIGCGTGDLLAALRPQRGLGIDFSPEMIARAKEKFPMYEWRVDDIEELRENEKFDYVVLSDLIGGLSDVERAFHHLKRLVHPRTRVVITYHNYLWEPFLRFAERAHLKALQPLQNWFSEKDIVNLLTLHGFEIIKKGKEVLLPARIPLFSRFVNTYVARLPFFSSVCLTHYLIARLPPTETPTHSVSIVIPARNERGNIEEAIKRIPTFGSYNEIIFIEGHSTDGTIKEIQRVAELYAGKRNIRWAIQKGKGKGDAVRKGFTMAKGDVLMILDADLTIAPEDLPKFYNAISGGRGEFINGSRLVYPLEKESMRFFNVLGNKFFSLAFSWLLGQRIKDTLCGTKVLFRKDYERIAAGRSFFGNFDPFGDFDLLFGAAKLNLKIVEIPVRYYARTYGRTNIQRWRHGWLLLKMAAFAARKIKFR